MSTKRENELQNEYIPKPMRKYHENVPNKTDPYCKFMI